MNHSEQTVASGRVWFECLRLDSTRSATQALKPVSAHTAGYWANLNPLHPVGRLKWAKSGALAVAAIRQAADLHRRLLDRKLGSERTLSTLSGFAGLTRENPLARILTLRRLGVHQQTRLRTLLVSARIALLRRTG